MDTLTIASSKGGTCKTTTAATLAVEAVRDGLRVTMLDLDAGQASLSAWWTLRGEPFDPYLEELDGRRFPVIAEDARREGRDVMLIDTPPGDIGLIRAALAISDAALIPVRPSVFDVLAIEATAEVCAERRIPFAFVLTDVDAKFSKLLIERTLEGLAPFGRVLAPRFSHRQAYLTAPGQGKSAAEIDRTLAREAAAAWSAARALMRDDEQGGRRHVG